MAKGSVRKKGNKWYYRFYVEDESGKLVQREFAGTASKSETEAMLRRPISPDSVLKMLHRVLKRAGLPEIRFHDMRHTFATVALQNGVDIKTVSGMLGHYSAGFTLDTYAHVTTAAQRQAANTMSNILSDAVEH